MTVKELIALLARYPGDTEVAVAYEDMLIEIEPVKVYATTIVGEVNNRIEPVPVGTVVIDACTQHHGNERCLKVLAPT